MSWPLVKLGEVAPSKALKNPVVQDDDNVWQLNLDMVESGSGRILNKLKAPLSEAGSSTHWFDDRHVLYSKLRPYLNKVVLPDELGLATTELVPMLPEPKMLDRRYLVHYLRSNQFVSWISDQVAGAKMPRVSMKVFWDHEIPLPPLEEQKRIAAILDKADAIRQKRKQAIELGDEFLRSVFLDMFGDPVTNPKGFEKVSLGNVCKIKGGKRIPKGEKLVKENTGYPYIKAGNIKNGKVNTNKLEYVPNHVREKISRYTVNADDVCLTVVGANIGDVGIVPKELDNASLTENANKLLIQNKKIMTNFYLASALQMDFMQNQMKLKTMAVGVPKLALFRIEQLELLIPPIELQKKFELIVDKVDKYLNKIIFSNEICDTNFAALSQKAFSGQL